MRGFVLLAACSGTVYGALVDGAGPLAPLALYSTPVLAVVAALLALFAPPLPGTPAARRCQRTPITQARAPRVLATLEQR